MMGLLVALLAATAAGRASLLLAYVALGAAGALTIGFLDDKRWIGPRTKFAGQIAVAAGVAAALHAGWLPIAAAIPAGTLVLVASMNSFNFLDNIDGLSAGTAGIAAGALALMTLVVGGDTLRVLGCAAAGACVGFLPLNYRPGHSAALFMGDSGSHLLGLVVGAGALLAAGGAGGNAADVVAPLLILALPILDTSLVIIVRLAEGRPVWKGGRDHISHRLVYVGLSERRAVAALLGLSAVCAGVGLTVVAGDNALVTGAAIGIVVALLVALGSRLALVTERMELTDALAVSGHVPVEDAAVARDQAGTERMYSRIELQNEPEAEEVQDRARAN
jgi:UDP-GlcNAc:undecaprenyl-phosphate GlcNAc-1-phosphate transferase